MKLLKNWCLRTALFLGVLGWAAGCNNEKKHGDELGAYLFAYFTGNGPGEEAIRYAISPDGFNYRALNENKPIVSSDSISSTGGVRDPHIIRGEDGKTYYMVVTDLYVPNMGWRNYALILMKSTDMINWTSSVVHIPSTFPKFAEVTRVWAPQVIYDTEEGKYMIYFSMLMPGGVDIIYYTYANEDFTGLSMVPKQLFFSPTNSACIDGDIVYKDGKYHLFFKTEGSGNGIKRAVSDKLTEGYEMIDKYINLTTDAVEGSGTFKLINSDKYILMYDVYMAGTYQFTETTDLENFKVIDHDISMNFHPRHGSVLPITNNETKSLIKQWPSIFETDAIFTSNSELVKKKNVIVDGKNGKVYLPLKQGANHKSFDPQFVLLPGATISPKTPQDFTNGPVQYAVSLEGVGEKTYEVSAVFDNNPALVGYYADPEIIYSEKHGKFFLYPTSDGYPRWSGNYFKAFSSSDLVNWTDEGVILDLTKDVEWTDRNAWAPAMTEKKIGDEYKYFYYFTAAQKIGVAVSNHPSGKFVDSGKPLIDFKPAGVTGGQEIDPDVFTDPVSGKSYLYWGNGYMAVAELSEDMVSIKRETIKVMTPDATFREGIEVFYRNGLYYFLWSENDTRDEDYRVRYATSDSPIGKLNIPEDNLVIAKDPDQGIYGTGHNSVIQIPGTDEWYIVYHRFTRPRGITMGRSAGYHREVCIDRMEFNEDGSIRRVTPSLKGIEPLKPKS
jgi:arabinoxylan arabinofuranohydrolase